MSSATFLLLSLHLFLGCEWSDLYAAASILLPSTRQAPQKPVAPFLRSVTRTRSAPSLQARRSRGRFPRPLLREAPATFLRNRCRAPFPRSVSGTRRLRAPLPGPAAPPPQGGSGGTAHRGSSAAAASLLRPQQTLRGWSVAVAWSRYEPSGLRQRCGGAPRAGPCCGVERREPGGHRLVGTRVERGAAPRPAGSLALPAEGDSGSGQEEGSSAGR